MNSGDCKCKFYRCDKCGNIIVKVEDSGMKPFCCGSVMQELFPQSNEKDDGEKHVPFCKLDENKLHVCVGTTLHPHVPEHYIQWIYVETTKGGYLRYLSAEEEPKACFCLCEGEKVKAVYAYCNIHGFWVGKM